ncbi:hypothetical protein DKY64_04905 [Stenotrophomonas maltophilia]|nr:hypothetical protein DKY64_04905 [Stenotrophomonas maltophilia]
MATSAGQRRHLIRFERAVDVRDPLGGPPKKEWHFVADAWAKKTNQLSATAEAIAAGAERYREQVRWDMLPRHVEPTWRIVERGKPYAIKSIAPSNDGSEMAIIAVAGLGNV